MQHPDGAGATTAGARDHGKVVTQHHETPFCVTTTALASRPRHALKHNDTFAVFDSHGDIGATGGSPDGLFHNDTRHLSYLELLINGSQPLLLGSAVKDDNLNFNVDLTNADIFDDGTIVLPKETIHISRTIYLYDGRLHERIVLVNHGAVALDVVLSLSFGSDFADIFEVRGSQRPRRGTAYTETPDNSTAIIHYRGLDKKSRRTCLTFDPRPQALFHTMARYELRLEPGVRQTVFVAVSCLDSEQPAARTRFFKGLVSLNREHKAMTSGVATVEMSNTVLDEVLRRSMADLYMLTTSGADGPYPYAGIPWYSTTFGRDGIISALQMLWIDPAIAVGVLRRLARYQAHTENAAADATPGKILHEMRGGEMAALGEVPFGFYFGSIDATPLFVVLAGFYAERTGDFEFIRELWPSIERALSWIDGPGDPDGDGFVEYARATKTGLANQGWKDSHDSISHADGRLAEGPIALIEVQAYVYSAKLLAARCARAIGKDDRASALERQAESLRQRINEAFWCEELGTYALALDGSKAQCRVGSSNAGHALACGIAPSDRARRIAQNLMSPNYFTGWGIRTLAQNEVRYNPMSYHNGSIWPHDNALIAYGFSRYGFKREISTIFESLFRAATYMDHRRIPELYCGFRRRLGRGPTLYPTACSPQAWAASAPLLLLQSMLGLEFDHARRTIRLINPVVPASIGDIVIRNLRLGDGSADFAVRQERNGISLQILRVTGNLQVSMVFDASAGQFA